MISFRSKGDFSKITGYFEKLEEVIKIGDLNIYGEEGVKALSEMTPKDSKRTSELWSYEIVHKKDSVSIVFKNDNINEGVPIAIILQYGHGTKNGGWVQGIDYINPAIQPLFNKIAENAWKEVVRV